MDSLRGVKYGLRDATVFAQVARDRVRRGRAAGDRPADECLELQRGEVVEGRQCGRSGRGGVHVEPFDFLGMTSA